MLLLWPVLKNLYLKRFLKPLLFAKQCDFIMKLERLGCVFKTENTSVSQNSSVLWNEEQNFLFRIIKVE